MDFDFTKPHKIVNGDPVYLTVEEWTAIQADWAANMKLPSVQADLMVTQSQLQIALAAVGLDTAQVGAAMTAVKSA